MFPLHTRFLIVEDNLGMRTVLVNALKDMGFTHFLEASDGQVALDLLNAGEKVDVILTDHYMPRVSGIDLLAQLHEHPTHKSIPVIVVTADSKRWVMVRALELGALGFLLKPVIKDQLQSKLSAAYSRLISADT